MILDSVFVAENCPTCHGHKAPPGSTPGTCACMVCLGSGIVYRFMPLTELVQKIAPAIVQQIRDGKT